MGWSSCNKKKWKLPVDVTFHVDINRSPADGGKLNFDGGKIVISEFEFDGKREQGDDVFFRKEFTHLDIPFDQNLEVAELDFEIPQGSYTKIGIRFKANNNAGSSIELEGKYTNDEGEVYPVRLEIKDDQYYSLVAHDGTGSNVIILDKDIPSNTTILLDPSYWFQTVSDSLLEEAEVSDDSGTPTILINEDENEEIFHIVQYRMDDATEVTFN